MPLAFNVSKEDFLPALNSLQSITGKKGTMAVLSNILIQSQDNFIELVATDLEVGIKKNVAAEIISPGSITLPAKILYEIVRESGSDSIKIEEKDKNWARIKAGTASVYNFQIFQNIMKNYSYLYPVKLLRNLLKKQFFQ